MVYQIDQYTVFRSCWCPPTLMEAVAEEPIKKNTLVSIMPGMRLRPSRDGDTQAGGLVLGGIEVDLEAGEPVRLEVNEKSRQADLWLQKQARQDGRRASYADVFLRDIPVWQPGLCYSGLELVRHCGRVWRSLFWTDGEAPGRGVRWGLATLDEVQRFMARGDS